MKKLAHNDKLFVTSYGFYPANQYALIVIPKGDYKNEDQVVLYGDYSWVMLQCANYVMTGKIGLHMFTNNMQLEIAKEIVRILTQQNLSV